MDMRSIAESAYRAGFRDTNLTLAVAVAMAESGGDPRATNRNTNGSTDLGLWQINDRVWDGLLKTGAWTDPDANARMAYAIWSQESDSRKWKDWVTFNRGMHLQYMPRAAIAAAQATKDNGKVMTPVAGGTQTVPSSGGGFGALLALPGFLKANFHRFVYAFTGILVLMFAVYQISGSQVIGNTLKTAAKAAAVA